MAQSCAVRQRGPILSIDHDSAIAPVRLTLPNVGRKPVTPFTVDGDTMEPQVSEPMAKGTNPAAVAEAEPADDPLEPIFVYHGLRVLPPNQTSPQANSPSESLATRTAPALSSLVITGDVISAI